MKKKLVIGILFGFICLILFNKVQVLNILKNKLEISKCDSEVENRNLQKEFENFYKIKGNSGSSKQYQINTSLIEKKIYTDEKQNIQLTEYFISRETGDSKLYIYKKNEKKYINLVERYYDLNKLYGDTSIDNDPKREIVIESQDTKDLYYKQDTICSVYLNNQLIQPGSDQFTKILTSVNTLIEGLN